MPLQLNKESIMQTDFITSAKQVIDIELNAIERLKQTLSEDFTNACDILLSNQGKVVVSGMGKSGHIGNKIAATFASTGTPSFFMHPGEASHGDLGMLSTGDVFVAISNSGESSELVTLLPVVKRLGVKIIAITGNPNSSLALQANVHLLVSVEKEACSLGLAPTASTTATLVLGDALAVALLDARGFTSEQFALSHPGGSLGKKLLLTLENVMHKGEQLPLVHVQDSVLNALMMMSQKGLGMTGIINAEKQLVGLFTDGDLRRILDHDIDLKQTAIGDVMTADSITVPASMMAAELLHIMEQKRINGVFVVDQQQRPIGAVNMHDLLKAGVM